MTLSLAGYHGDSSETRSGVGRAGGRGRTFSEILISAAAEQRERPSSTAGKTFAGGCKDGQNISLSEDKYLD